MNFIKYIKLSKLSAFLFSDQKSWYRETYNAENATQSHSTDNSTCYSYNANNAMN